MAQQATGKFAYILDTITRSAPVTSGVYTLFSRGACLYVGESDDICASLLEHYYVYNPCLNDKEITHFTFDLASPEVRRPLLIDRIQQLRPTGNQRTESSRNPHCLPAQDPSPSPPLAMAGTDRS
jgi:hypothetical protein